MAIYGSHAYVADGTGGMLVFDISSPFSISFRGVYTPFSAVLGVTVKGNLAYLANDLFLTIVDVSTPTSVSLVGSTTLGAAGADLDIRGRYATVATLAGVSVVQVATQWDNGLQFVSTIDLGGPNAEDMATRESLLFVADGTKVLVYDASGPGSPAQIGTYWSTMPATTVAVSGDRLYVGTATPGGASGIDIVDISDPYNAAPVGYGFFSTSSPRNIVLYNDFAIVSGFNEIVVVDINIPTQPATQHSLTTPVSWADFALDGRALYVTGSLGAETVLLDIDDVISGDYTTPGTPIPVLGFVFASGNAAIVDFDRVYFAGQFVDPSLVTHGGVAIARSAGHALRKSGYLSGMTGVGGVEGRYAYGGEGGDFRVVDLADPSAPTQRGVVTNAASFLVLDVATDGRYAVAGQWSGVAFYDVNDPDAPSQLGVVLPGLFGSVQTDGPIAFAYQGGGAGDTVFALNYTNPASAVVVGTLPGVSWAPVQSGVNLLTLEQDLGMRVYDVSNPAAMASVGFLSFPTTLRALSADDNLAALCRLDSFVTGEWILEVVDVSNPAAPAVLGSTPLVGTTYLPGWGPSEPLASFIDGDRVFVSGTGYTLAFDISDPATPVVAGVSSDRFGPQWGASSGHAWHADSFTPFGLQGFRLRHATARPGTGRSRPLTAGTSTVVSARLSAVQTGGISEPALSADGGASWTSVEDGVWTPLEVPGNRLVWRLDFDPVGTGTPGVPTGLLLTYNTPAGAILWWDPAPEPDFQFYRIYRGTDPGFVPSPATLLASTATPAWTDTSAATWQYTHNGPGQYRVDWNGTDAHGRQVASGVYFYRMEAGAFRSTHKMLLLK